MGLCHQKTHGEVTPPNRRPGGLRVVPTGMAHTHPHHTTHTTRSHRYAVSCPLPTCRGFWASGLPCPAGAPARPPTLARMARRRRTAPAGAACLPFGPSKRAGHWPAAAARPRQTTRFAEKPHAAQCTPTPDAHESQRYSGLLLTNNQGQTVGK
jgi:hypothetical protein